MTVLLSTKKVYPLESMTPSKLSRFVYSLSLPEALANQREAAAYLVLIDGSKRTRIDDVNYKPGASRSDYETGEVNLYDKLAKVGVFLQSGRTYTLELTGNNSKGQFSPVRRTVGLPRLQKSTRRRG